MGNVEKTDKNIVSFEFSVSPEEFEKAVQKAYKKNVKKINMPGFRKGKAPRIIIEKAYGKEVFYEDAINFVLPDAYDKAVEENGISPVAQPEVDLKSEKIEPDKEIIFTAKVVVKPEFELGEYKGVKAEKAVYETTDENVNEEIEKLRERNSRLVPVEDRAVQADDIANINFEGFVDGVAFEGGKAENHDLEIGSNTFIPGFEDQVIGMKIDEERDINVKFPEEYFLKDLAGKDATFKVKELPKLDDEFAKDVSEFDTLAELKKSIKDKQKKQNEQKAKYETQEAVMKAVCDDMKVEIPSGMIETETENMMKDMEQRLAYQGLKLEQYLEIMGKTKEDMQKEYEPQAAEAIKSRLALEAIIKAEKIEVEDKDVEEKMKEMAKNYGKENDEEFLKNENVKNYIKEGLQSEKAIEFLVENAKMKK